jgi:hypothetical protein
MHQTPIRALGFTAAIATVLLLGVSSPAAADDDLHGVGGTGLSGGDILETEENLLEGLATARGLPGESVFPPIIRQSFCSSSTVEATIACLDEQEHPGELPHITQA